MEMFHSCFKFWRSFERKQDFSWVAITKSTPPDYYGNEYKTLAPIGERFDKLCEPVFQEGAFFREYAKLLGSLNRDRVLADLARFSPHGKDIVLLNWEDLSKKSEGRFAYAWLFNLTMEQADQRDLELVLKERKKQEELEASLYGGQSVFLDI